MTKPETNTKINKINKYLVELKPEQNPLPTKLTTNHQNNPNKLSIMEKIKKFSSRSPSKLPPSNRNPEPNQKPASKPTKVQPCIETKPNPPKTQNKTTTPPQENQPQAQQHDVLEPNPNPKPTKNNTGK